MLQQDNVIVQFDNVVFRYPYSDRQILNGATFCLINGVNTILCDTASGKTTICKLLCKDVLPTSGSITLFGNGLRCITNADLGILYLPQQPTFFGNKSVLHNIAYPLKVRKVPRKLRLQIAKDVCRELDIDYTQTKAKKLSPSQAQRVALARGVTVDRRIVLLDDWNDTELINRVLRLFNNSTVVICTSDVGLAQGNVIVLDYGKCIFQGESTEAQQIVANCGWLFEQIKEEK